MSEVLREVNSPFIRGLTESLGVMIGYIPVAIAFGITANAADIEWVPVLMSGVMYTGAGQFVMLDAIITGKSLILTVGLCALMDIRHLFFGPVMSKAVPMSLKQRVLGAFGMNDEVFAISSSKAKNIPLAYRIKWYFGLMMGAYFSWVFGTFLGVLVGDWIIEQVKPLEPALPFAFPALFFVLMCLNFSRQMFMPILITLVVTGIICILFSSGPAIIIGAVSGMGYYYFTNRNVNEEEIE